MLLSSLIEVVCGKASVAPLRGLTSLAKVGQDVASICPCTEIRTLIVGNLHVFCAFK